MKRAWFWSLLFGLLLGVGLGIVVATRWIQPAVPTGTALLREFSWPAVAAQAGQTNWLVIEDRIYEPFPALAQTKRIARRIVARTEMSDDELTRFATQFPQALRAALEAHGAVNKAQFELVQDAARVVDNSPVRSRLDLPRRYYAIGNIHGVADFWYIAESGRVTAIVSLIEGL